MLVFITLPRPKPDSQPASQPASQLATSNTEGQDRAGSRQLALGWRMEEEWMEDGWMWRRSRRREEDKKEIRKMKIDRRFENPLHLGPIKS
jgi:hypothetical protein